MNNDTRVADKFWARVNKTGECWEWTATKSPKGYGKFKHDGKQRNAHRVAYELTHGDVPPGYLIDHVCFTRVCCNPAHLRAVPQHVNSAYRKGANNNNPTGHRGVTYRKATGNWRAQVNHKGEVVFRKEFKSLDEAVRATQEARAKYHVNVGN